MSNFKKIGNRVYLQKLRGQGTAVVWCEQGAGGFVQIRVQGAHLKLMERVALVETARVALRQANAGVEITYWNSLLHMLASH